MAVTIIVQIITFLGFLYLLYRLTWRQLRNVMRNRSQRIETNLSTAEENIRRAQETQRETDGLLAQARTESQAIITQANRAAEAQRQALMEQAGRDAENLVQRARDTIGRERQAAVDELRREAALGAVNAARRVLDRSLDANVNRELADQTIADVGGGR